MLLAISACSTKKNTSGTRFYNAMTARFNTYFNGSEAFKEGIEEQQKGHKDNYTALLPMYYVRNKTTAAIGKTSFTTAIEKCEKAIKQHSIKVRPKSNVNKRKTAEEKAYLARKEFNPFLRHAWLLMGKAQFQQGNFIESASTFNYICDLYAGQPDVVSVARAYLARCYVELGWPYDAEDVFGKIRRDSISSEGKREYNASYADYLIFVKQYDDAIPYLQKAIKNEKSKNQRARLNFLLGQIYHEVNNPTEAYKALRRVVRANPPYELSFSAQILQSEVMSTGNRAKMVKKLRRMVKNKKNKNYQDQIYYAIGNIYLADNDTAKCIGAYETGAKESTQNGIAKAMVLLRLGEVYWDKEDYINAQRCYTELIGILDKENENYTEAERRNNILTELEPHLSAIKLQDSLQWLAKLPEADRNQAIDRVIEALKKQEKEEARKAMNAEMASKMPQSTTANPAVPAGKNGTQATGQTTQSGIWYFYNPTAVAQGKRQFARTWGKRKLEDNWRRSHKNEDRSDTFGEHDYSEDSDSILAAKNDSIAAADSIAEAQGRMADSLVNDPHHREYYLQQIPFTEEQLQSSNDILRDALYQAGILEMEKLEDFDLARRTLLRLIQDFPDVENKDNAYYHLFLVNGRLNDLSEAELYKQRLIEEFPTSPYAVMLANPHYELYAKQGKHIEDSLYAATYEAYERNDYAQVSRNYATSTTDFPNGAHRAKFMFIQAMSQLYTGQRDSFLVTLKQVIAKYPKDEVTEIAQGIAKGIQEGRSLTDGKYDASDIWSRRTAAAQQDSTATAQQLSDERLCNFVFMLAYPENTLDEDQLLYEMALYNFTSFMVRNFDINIVKADGLAQMRVSGFLNYDEAHAYAQKLYADPHMSVVLKNIRSIIISENNLKLLGSVCSFDDYKKFYDKKFAPLQVPKGLKLDEPTSIEIRTPDDEPPAQEKKDNNNEEEDTD
ncbi:MAG: tetratricopeptide repeat protein, partial [Paraprevotella sp.]|nr:tetratricopeptide repeat protein [Paraprevotella sp.]